ARVAIQKIPTAAELAVRAWRTVEELALLPDRSLEIARALDHPHLAQVRALELSCHLLARLDLDRELDRVRVTMPLAMLPPRLRIRELIVTQGYVDDARPARLLAWIAEQPQAHALRSIVIEPSDDALGVAVAWLRGGALPELERVALDADAGWPWRLELVRK